LKLAAKIQNKMGCVPRCHGWTVSKISAFNLSLKVRQILQAGTVVSCSLAEEHATANDAMGF
jgi:hypothetical protein